MLSPYTALSPAAIGDSEAVALISIVILLAVVVVKQLATGVDTRRATRLDRILLIPIPALLVVFLAEVFSRSAAALGF